MSAMLTFEYRGLGPEHFRSDYQESWDYQRRVHAEVATGRRPGHVILLEHEPVYTAGRATRPEERPFDGTPVVDVDRGGKITWHGPGQLTGYPILPLPAGVGVVDPIRRFEDAIIDLLSSYGLEGQRVTGVAARFQEPAGTQDLRHRNQGCQTDHPARFRPQRAPEPGSVRKHCSLRHQRCRSDLTG